MKRFGKLVIACGLTLLAGLPVAHAATLTANAQGECSPMGCTSSGTFTGSTAGAEYRNYFAFNIPLGQLITSATINIFNNGQNTDPFPDDQYSLYVADGVSYGDLVNGPAVGSMSVASIDTGVSHFVSISLNAAGVAAINADQGGNIIFGGAISPSEPSQSGAFGFIPETATLDVAFPTVPLPSSLASFGAALLGFAAIGYGRRMKRRTLA